MSARDEAGARRVDEPPPQNAPLHDAPTQNASTQSGLPPTAQPYPPPRDDRAAPVESTDLRRGEGQHRDVEERHVVKPAKTGAAAAFALAFGVGGLLLVLTLVFSPVGLVFAILGIILGIVGIRSARRTGVTGKGVAITGLVFSVIAVLLVVAGAVGVTTVLNDPTAVNQLQQQLQQLRDQLPTTVPKP